MVEHGLVGHAVDTEGGAADDGQVGREIARKAPGHLDTVVGGTPGAHDADREGVEGLDGALDEEGRRGRPHVKEVPGVVPIAKDDEPHAMGLHGGQGVIETALGDGAAEGGSIAGGADTRPRERGIIGFQEVPGAFQFAKPFAEAAAVDSRQEKAQPVPEVLRRCHGRRTRGRGLPGRGGLCLPRRRNAASCRPSTG